VLGRRVELGATVVEYEPPWRFVSKDDGPIPVRAQRLFEAFDGGTRVTLKVEAEPSGFLKIAEPLLAPILKRRLEADANRAKRLLDEGAV
jgi:hypothetical protein